MQRLIILFILLLPIMIIWETAKNLEYRSFRPWSIRGRFFCALQALQRVRPCPYTPRQLPAACVASYGPQAAFCARG